MFPNRQFHPSGPSWYFPDTCNQAHANPEECAVAANLLLDHARRLDTFNAAPSTAAQLRVALVDAENAGVEWERSAVGFELSVYCEAAKAAVSLQVPVSPSVSGLVLAARTSPHP